jgi:hypothetical protein
LVIPNAKTSIERSQSAGSGTREFGGRAASDGFPSVSGRRIVASRAEISRQKPMRHPTTEFLLRVHATGMDVRTPFATLAQMKWLPTVLSAVLVLAACAFADGGTGPLKVFILAGQSNMEGQAVVDLAGKDYNEGKGTLVQVMQDPVKSALFKHLKDIDGKWTVRDDVWVRDKPEHGAVRVGPLTFGFTSYGDAHHFGPSCSSGMSSAMPSRIRCCSSKPRGAARASTRISARRVRVGNSVRISRK